MWKITVRLGGADGKVIATFTHPAEYRADVLDLGHGCRLDVIGDAVGPWHQTLYVKPPGAALTDNDRLVLRAIADVENEGGEHPRAIQIESRAGLSGPEVQASLLALVDGGYLEYSNTYENQIFAAGEPTTLGRLFLD